MPIADAAQTGIVPAGGTLRLRFTPNARQNWIVQQVSVNGAMFGAVAVGSGSQCEVFLDTSFIATLAQPKDVAAGEPYVTLNNGRSLVVVITGAVVGATVQAVILYDDGNDDG